MPIYRYTCLDCKRRFEVFQSYADYGTKPVTCTHCRSQNIQRRQERIRVARSEESRLDDLADPSSLEGLENDPRALGRMMRKMKDEMGSETEGDIGPEFDEVVNRLEKGQSPEDIERAMPELADSMGDDGGMGGMGGMPGMGGLGDDF
jgi:putative FmdB family regulatory protein